jgi:methyl-accepting chemotaxis protein
MLISFLRSIRRSSRAQKRATAVSQHDLALHANAQRPLGAGSLDPARLANIAHSSVQLAELGPRLAAFAAELEGQAQSQAARASSIAETMAALTRNLDQAVEALRGSSRKVGDALSIVERIAQQTRILSINASIEAARAGQQGRAFVVIVDEVQRLADRTGDTTHEIATNVFEMQKGIAQVEAVTGDADAGASSAVAACTVDARASRGMRIDDRRGKPVGKREIASLDGQSGKRTHGIAFAGSRRVSF